jgi:two-component system OmpR family sensor kinase
LAPIPTEGLPQEALGLVSALNGLLTRLQESLESQRRFASDAAHELRTPLTALKLQIQLAELAKTPEAQQKAFSRLHEGIERATRLVQQLLTIARLDPDATQKPFLPVSLNKVLQSTHDEMTVLAEQKAIEISTDLLDVNVNGMEDALKLLVTNLTDNAIRYTPEGGKIRLRVSRIVDQAVIEISDNGPGIAPEERERIFDRFYRALGTKTQGHGLGLAIVKRIVELHQGEIYVDDGLDERGTTMRIELPLAK